MFGSPPSMYGFGSEVAGFNSQMERRANHCESLQLRNNIQSSLTTTNIFSPEYKREAENSHPFSGQHERIGSVTARWTICSSEPGYTLYITYPEYCEQVV